LAPPSVDRWTPPRQLDAAGKTGILVPTCHSEYRAADVELEGGTKHVARIVPGDVDLTEEAEHGAAGEEEADEKACRPAMAGDSERGQTSPFDEEHVAPRNREAAQPEDEDPEQDVERHGTRREQEGERAAEGGKRSGAKRGVKSQRDEGGCLAMCRARGWLALQGPTKALPATRWSTP
jgi:hypothetical protein